MGHNSAILLNRAVLWATVAAQALALRCVVPGTGTIDIVSCRVRVVLFRTVLVPAHRARAKWPGMDGKAKKSTHSLRGPRHLGGREENLTKLAFPRFHCA
jgi:hypothetical protein